MGFLNPLLLLGLVAAGIPLALHLFRRRHAPTVAFGPMELLLRAERRVRQRIRLRDLLLLFARISILVFLVTAAARPYVRVPSVAGLSDAVPSSVVLVLDDSMSMRAGGRRSAFESARAAALDAISSLGSDDNAALVLASRPVRAVSASLSFDHQQVREAIVGARPGYRGTDLEGALALARQLLAPSVQPLRRIVLLSDMARHGFPEGYRGMPADDGIELRVVDVGLSDVGNRAVSAVGARAATEVGPRVRAIQASVTNYGDRPLREVVVSLHVGGNAVARGFLDLPAHGTRQKTFFHGFEAAAAHPTGWDAELSAEVRIAPDDLAADDSRSIALDEDRRERVLVVNGDPRPARYEDEVFYLVRALSALGLAPSVTDTLGLAGHRFADQDAVLLVNVPELAGDRLAELRTFVRGGGGLLFAPGDHMVRTSFNRDLGELFGATIEGEPESGAFRLGRPDRTQPVAEAFPPTGAGLVSAHFSRRLRVRASPGVRIPLRFEDGRPALSIASVGAGRTALFATTIDRDWGDLPIRPGFVVLTRELVRFLTGDSVGSSRSHEIYPGQPRELRPSGEVRRIVVKTPSGQTVDLGRGPATFRGTERPGLYQVLVERAQGGLTTDAAQSFVVNPDPAESDLARVDDVPGLERAGPFTLASGRRKVPLGPYVLAVIPFLVLAETLLRRR